METCERCIFYLKEYDISETPPNRHYCCWDNEMPAVLRLATRDKDMVPPVCVRFCKPFRKKD